MDLYLVGNRMNYVETCARSSAFLINYPDTFNEPVSMVSSVSKKKKKKQEKDNKIPSMKNYKIWVSFVAAPFSELNFHIRLRKL